MAIHDRHSIRGALDADIYGTQAADASVPKYKLGQAELRVPLTADKKLGIAFFADEGATKIRGATGAPVRPIVMV